MAIKSAPLSQNVEEEEEIVAATPAPLSGGVTVDVGRPKAGAIGVSGKTNLGHQETTELLRNMQAELDKRNSPMNTFLGGLQRASAWGSGGANGPSAALTAMDREEMLRSQDTQAMQEKMLAIKAAQAARERFLSGVGYTQPQAQAQAQAGAMPQAQAGAMSQAQAPTMPQQGGQVPEWQQVINRMPINYRGPATRALQNGDEAGWNSIIAAVEKNRTPDSRNLEELQAMPSGAGREMFMGQTFEKGIAPRSYIGADGKTYGYSPQSGMPGGLSSMQPNRALATGSGGNIVDAAAWAKENNIPVSPRGGTRTFEGQLDQYIENPNKAALPGRSMHETGRAIDVPAAARTPEVLAKLKSAGFTNTLPNEPWHFELPKASGKLSLPSVNTAKPGTSKEDVALQQKALEGSNQSFLTTDYKTITERANEAKNIERLSDQVLANIEGNSFGPGTKLAQSFAEYAQLAGVTLSPKETQKFVDNMGIETARKFLSAAGARQAMGAQFTKVEADDWLKAFAGIDNKKEYLKNFYQVQRAGALVDQDVKNYLLRNKGREQDAYIEWQDSGRKDKIMQENVDFFKNGKLGKVEIPGAKPAAKTEKTVKKTGMVTDKNNPNYGKSVTLYNDGSMEYK